MIPCVALFHAVLTILNCLKDRQYFDSADYIIGGKQNEPSQKTIPKTVQKGELLHPSARKLSPRNVEDNAQHSTATTANSEQHEDNEE